MREYLLKNWVEILAALVISSVISYGLSDFIVFSKSVCISTPLVLLIIHFLNKKPDEIVKAEQLVSELDGIIGEQAKILEEYEQIFDSQLVELPCVCGGNTFQGLFSPKTENIVECEKCKNKYRVTINYDSVMISEPLNIDQTFDQLIKTGI